MIKLLAKLIIFFYWMYLKGYVLFLKIYLAHQRGRLGAMKEEKEHLLNRIKHEDERIRNAKSR